MGCNCRGGKSRAKWQASFGPNGGAPQVYDTQAEAAAAVRAAGNPAGSTVRAVQG